MAEQQLTMFETWRNNNSRDTEKQSYKQLTRFKKTGGQRTHELLNNSVTTAHEIRKIAEQQLTRCWKTALQLTRFEKWGNNNSRGLKNSGKTTHEIEIAEGPEKLLEHTQVWQGHHVEGEMPDFKMGEGRRDRSPVLAIVPESPVADRDGLQTDLLIYTRQRKKKNEGRQKFSPQTVKKDGKNTFILARTEKRKKKKTWEMLSIHVHVSPFATSKTQPSWVGNKARGIHIPFVLFPSCRQNRATETILLHINTCHSHRYNRTRCHKVDVHACPHVPWRHDRVRYVPTHGYPGQMRGMRHHGCRKFRPLRHVPDNFDPRPKQKQRASAVGAAAAAVFSLHDVHLFCPSLQQYVPYMKTWPFFCALVLIRPSGAKRFSNTNPFSA